MFSMTCKKCGRIVQGYGEKNADLLMRQHNVKHEHEEYWTKKEKTIKK